ncbi:unnamed protein product [Sphagnum compactum]
MFRDKAVTRLREQDAKKSSRVVKDYKIGTAPNDDSVPTQQLFQLLLDRESNSRESASFDSRPLKVGNRPEILGCRGRATYRWKALDESYNFASDCIAIQGLLAKLWGSKVAGVPFGAISGLPRGSPGKNSHLDVASVESCRVYYKGEGGGFPQVRAVARVSEYACQFFLVYPGTFSTPLSPPPSSARSRERAPSSNSFRIATYLDPQVGPLGTWECVK